MSIVNQIHPCRSCGGKKIDVKTQEELIFENGEKKMKVWAFCRNCGRRGLSVTARFRDMEDARDSALLVWNNE